MLIVLDELPSPPSLYNSMVGPYTVVSFVVVSVKSNLVAFEVMVPEVSVSEIITGSENTVEVSPSVRVVVPFAVIKVPQDNVLSVRFAGDIKGAIREPAVVSTLTFGPVALVTVTVIAII
jgi:hypothetical protein